MSGNHLSRAVTVSRATRGILKRVPTAPWNCQEFAIDVSRIQRRKVRSEKIGAVRHSEINVVFIVSVTCF